MAGPFLCVQPRRAYSLQGPGTLAPDLAYGYSNGWVVDRTTVPRLPVRHALGSPALTMLTPGGPAEKTVNAALPAPGPTDVWSRGGSTVTVTFYLSSLASFQPILCKALSAIQHWTLSVYTDGNIRLESLGYFGNSGIQTSGGGHVVAGKVHTLSVTTLGTAASIYLDGKKLATGSLGVQTQTDAGQSLTVGYGLPYGGSFTSASALFVSHLSVAYKELPLGRLRELALDPNRMFMGPERNLGFLPDTYGAITVPGSDVAVSGWTSTPGAGFATMVNEFLPNDTSYITSPFAGEGDPIIMELGRPLEAGQWNVRFRANFVGSFANSVVVRLLDAANNVVGTAQAELLTVAMQTHTVAVDTTATAYRVSIEAV